MAEVKSKFSADNKKFLTAIKQMRSGMGGFGKSMASIGKTIAKGLAGAAAAVIGLGVAFTAGLKKALDFADAIGKTADQVGVSTKFLQEFRFAMDLAGASTAASDKILVKLSKNIGELKVGTGALSTFLLKYDKSLIKAFQSTESIEEATSLLLDVMEKEIDSTKRLALGFAAAGKSGAVLITALKDGTDAFKENMKMASRLGAVIRDKFVRRAEEAKDEITILASVIKVQLTEAFIALAPTLTRVIGFFEDNVEVVTRLINGIAILFNQLDLLSLEALRNELKETQTSINELTEPTFFDQLVLTIGLVDTQGKINKLLEKERELRTLIAKETLRGIQQFNRLQALRDAPKPKTLAGTKEDAAETKAFDKLIKRLIDEGKETKRLREERERLAKSRSDSIKSLNDELVSVQRLVNARMISEEAFQAEIRAQEVLQRIKAVGVAADDRDIVKITQTANEIVNLNEQLEKLGETIPKIRDPFKEAVDFMKVGIDDVSRFWTTRFDEMTDALAEFAMTGKLDFKSLMDSFTRDILKFYIKAALFGQQSGFGGIFGGGLAGIFSAKGNAFSGSNSIIPFAKGGVTNQPFAFQMGNGKTGIAGEAGPEAIVPLKRDSKGNLGVVSTGGGSNTTTNQFFIEGVSVTVTGSTPQEIGRAIGLIVADKTTKSLIGVL